MLWLQPNTRTCVAAKQIPQQCGHLDTSPSSPFSIPSFDPLQSGISDPSLPHQLRPHFRQPQVPPVVGKFWALLGFPVSHGVGRPLLRDAASAWMRVHEGSNATASIVIHSSSMSNFVLPFDLCLLKYINGTKTAMRERVLLLECCL